MTTIRYRISDQHYMLAIHTNFVFQVSDNVAFFQNYGVSAKPMGSKIDANFRTLFNPCKIRAGWDKCWSQFFCARLLTYFLRGPVSYLADYR